MSKKTIKFGEGGLVGTYSPLIPFSCIFDIPVGLLELIRNEYRSDIFDIELLDNLSKDRRKLIYTLYQRKLENPLIEFMKEPNFSIAEDLYKQFIKEKYSEILDHSVHTGIYELCTLFATTSEIKASIYYSREEELSLLKEDSNLIGIDFINGRSLSEKINSFGQIFINSLYDNFAKGLMKNIDHKNIYILDYKYNFEEDGKLMTAPSLIAFEGMRNTINIINAYNLSKLQNE